MNPVVAVLLGWLLLGEHVGPRTFVAMGLILGAVVWIQLSHFAAARAARAEAEAPAAD